MPPLAAAAAPLLDGPVAGAISSIADSIGSSVSGALGGAADQAAAGLFGKDVLGTLEKEFKNILANIEAQFQHYPEHLKTERNLEDEELKQKELAKKEEESQSGGGGRRIFSFPPRPAPFSPSNINIQNNPFGGVGQLGQQLGPIRRQLSDLTGKRMPQFDTAGAGAGGSASAGPGGFSGAGDGSSIRETKNYGGNLDAMMADADKLLQSDKMSDQLQGQQLLSKASNMFQALSKFYSQQADMQMAASRDIR